MRLLKLLLVLFVCGGVSACSHNTSNDARDATTAHRQGDHAPALRIWRPLADQGNAQAQYNLGLLYTEGKAVPQDYAAAVSWFRKAADQGDAQAQIGLGMMYDNGWGVPQDYAAAAAWCRKAADQGNAIAQSNLGIMYKNGQGVPQDDAQAVFWYRKAADQGEPRAQVNLGFMYEKGQGVPQDYAVAGFWYRKAATQTTDDEARARAKKNIQELPNITPAAVSSAAMPQQSSVSGSTIPMKREGGTYVVPVLINNAITLDFTVDSGASDVSIPEDVVSTLIRAGTIRDTDFVGEQIYTLADGSKVKSHTFRIRSLKVGDRVLENVTGSVAPAKGSLLLGQSFLGRFKSWSIDNGKHVLVLE